LSSCGALRAVDASGTRKPLESLEPSQALETLGAQRTLGPGRALDTRCPLRPLLTLWANGPVRASESLRSDITFRSLWAQPHHRRRQRQRVPVAQPPRSSR